MPGGGAPLLARICDFRVQHVQNAPAADAAVRAPSDIASQLMHVLLRNVHLAMHHTAIDIEEDPTCFDDLRSALFACLNLLPRAGDEAETQAATPSNFQVCGADAPVADAEDISHGSAPVTDVAACMRHSAGECRFDAINWMSWSIIHFRNLTAAYILEFACMCIHIERHLCHPAC